MVERKHLQEEVEVGHISGPAETLLVTHVSISELQTLPRLSSPPPSVRNSTYYFDPFSSVGGVA